MTNRVLDGRVAFFSGSARGCGREMAIGFAAAERCREHAVFSVPARETPLNKAWQPASR
jgi:NAD(P)-dependent dehydrogenase (short-subunit alcohol dehydrogenase family)